MGASCSYVDLLAAESRYAAPVKPVVSLAPGALALFGCIGCNGGSNLANQPSDGLGGTAGNGTEETGGAPSNDTGGANNGTGGSGGSDGSGGEPSDTRQPVRSAGCGNSDFVTGERQMEVAGHSGRYIVSVPTSYDPEVPLPMGFAFHGRNRNHQNCQAGDCAGFQSAMGEVAVLVYLQSLRTPPDSTDGGWEGNGEREENVEFFEKVLDTLLGELCIDESRVFVAGTSSGAHFTNILGCRFGDRLAAIAPVAGYLPESTGCVGHPAALVIHGVDDNLSTGEQARDFWVSRNGCSTSTVPDLAEMHQDIRDKRDAMPSVEDHGCVDYQGCTEAPVRWCEHSFGGYDNSTHGWPPTGGQLIWEFVQGLE